MEFRVGTCTSCSKKFKVPATFQSDKAKCKHCGGVVEIAAPEAKAKTKAPSPKPAPVPAKRPRPVASKKPTAAPAVASAGVAKAAVAATDSVRSKTRATGQRVKAAGTKTASAGTKAKPSSRARSSGTSGSPRASARSSGSTSRRSRKPQAAPKKSNAGMIVAIVLLVAGLGTGAFFMMKDGEGNSAQAAETQVTLANANPLEDVTTGKEGTAAGMEDVTSGSEDAPPAQEPGTQEPEASANPDIDPEPIQPAASEQKAVVLLDLIEELPNLEPLAGTAPERATELRQWMAEYIDPDAGAAGSRAGKRLQEAPKEAFPIIINAFKRIDTTNEDGFRAGDLTQKLLERLCNGNNFDWRYPAQGAATLEPKDVLYNQKVVRAWHGAWLKAKDDEAYWLKLTKQTAPAKETKKPEKLDDF